MARTTKVGTGAQPPRKPDDTPTVEGVQHVHFDDDGNPAEDHLHRGGDRRHVHLADGKVEFADGHTDQLPRASDPPLPEGFGSDQFGTDPATGTYHAPPDPAPGSHHADMLNGEAEAKAAAHRAKIAGAVTPAEVKEMEAIRDRHPDILPEGYQPRPNVLAGPPGSRLADVSSFSSTLTLFGVPVELQDELTWAQIAKHALDSMIEEVLRTRQPSDPALVAAAFDAILHVAKSRGVA
jgi:hypothetical protein